MSDIFLAFPSEAFERHIRTIAETRPNLGVNIFESASQLKDFTSIISEYLGELTASNPHVVTIGPDLDISESLSIIRRIDSLCPEISVVLVQTPTADLWREALLAGARDIIDPNDDADTIAAALERATELAFARRESIRGQRHELIAAPPKGRIVVIVSPKGGSGKTVLATNLAVTLARSSPGNVVLVDLDLQFGDIASSLSLNPKYTMYTATQASGSEASLLKAFLTPHASQLLVLCAPEDPTEADDVKEGDAARIVQELSKLFAWVVVDTGAGLDDLTIAAAEVATDLVLLSSTDVPSVRGIRKEALIMDQLGIRAERHFVLNRSDAKVGLSPSDIALSVGLPITGEIPSSRSVPTSINIGVPVVDHESRSSAARGIALFAMKLLESGNSPQNSPKRTRRFRK